MTTSNNNHSAETTIVSFYIGRGGRFHNPGHKFFRGEESIQDVMNIVGDSRWMFLGFENQANVNPFDQEKHPLAFEKVNELISLSTDGYRKELAKYGITEKSLGELGWLDINGHFIISQKDVDSGVGTLNFDREYCTYFTQKLSDCDIDELKLIAEEGYNHLIAEYYDYKYSADLTQVDETFVDENGNEWGNGNDRLNEKESAMLARLIFEM